MHALMRDCITRAVSWQQLSQVVFPCILKQTESFLSLIQQQPLSAAGSYEMEQADKFIRAFGTDVSALVKKGCQAFLA